MAKRKSFDRTRWQVARERFRLPDAQPPSPESSGAIGDTIRAVFEKMDAKIPVFWTELEREWPGLAGPEVTRHARLACLNGRTLVIDVDSSAWLTELVRFHRARLLGALQRRFGASRIQSLRFQANRG